MKKLLQKSILFLFFSVLNLMQWQSFAECTNKALLPTVTLTTESLPAANIVVSNNYYVVYALKVISTEAFTLNGISFKVDGTFTAGNIQGATLGTDTSPNPFGGTQIAFNNSLTTVSAGGTISFTGFSQSIAANTPRYFYLRISLTTACPAGRIIRVDGSVNPVTLTSTASVLTITNNQTNICGPFTTVIPTLTLTTEPLAGFNAPIGGSSQLLYVMKIMNDFQLSAITQIKVKFAGTFLAGDISGVSIAFSNNPTPAGIGLFSTFVNGASLANGNTLTVPTSSWSLNASSTQYLLVRVDLSTTATAGRTVKIDGSNNPVAFTSTSSTPTIVNNQTDITGPLTITAPDITLTTEPLAASNISPNTFGTIYVLKVFSTSGAVLRGINIPIQGTFTSADINSWGVFIASTPTAISGTSLGGPYY